MKEISTTKLKSILKEDPKALIIDVRDKDEYDFRHIPSAKNIPLSDIEDYSDEIPTDRPVYFICKSGNRSSHAIILLNDLDINNVINVRGGMLSWDGEIKSR